MGYKHYGGRGIGVCERWFNFENFYADMGTRPQGLSLDRMNNNDGYKPSNCRWATLIEQYNNTSRNVKITYNGLTLSISQWAERMGIKYRTLQGRINRGWSIEKSLTKGRVRTCV